MSPAIIALVVIAGQTSAAPGRDDVDLRCGSYCLYVGLLAIGAPVGSFEELERKIGQPTLRGYSMDQLANTATEYGVSAIGVTTTAERLALRPQPFACIALLDGRHFVNIAEVGETEVSIIDPPREYSLPKNTFQRRWDGTALLISRTALPPEEGLPLKRSGAGQLIFVATAGATLFITASILYCRRRRLVRYA